MFSLTPPSSVPVPSIREALRVGCFSKGSPLPTVTWHKNNVSLTVINKWIYQRACDWWISGSFRPADQATNKCVARNVYNDTVGTSTRICKSKKTVQPRSQGLIPWLGKRPWERKFHCRGQIAHRVAVPSPQGKTVGRERLRKAGTNRVVWRQGNLFKYVISM